MIITGDLTDEPIYFTVEELMNSSNHKSDEDDIGGVHVYMEVESLLYNNFSQCKKYPYPHSA